MPSHPAEAPLQPLLNGAIIVLCAPTHVWSGTDGDLGAAPIDGVYHGDTRHIRRLTVTADGHRPEAISLSHHAAGHVTFGTLLRRLDDPSADPKVRMMRNRVVRDGIAIETLTIASHLPYALSTTLRLTVEPEFAPLQEVKAGAPMPRPWSAVRSNADVAVSSGEQSFTLSAPGARMDVGERAVQVVWDIEVPASGEVSVTCTTALFDPSLVVRGVSGAGGWPPVREEAGGESTTGVRDFPASIDPRLSRWLDVALGDLDALRLALPEHPEDEFFAAGAPWFFTLFGRDSIWAARLALPVDRQIAASTLRVLARLQGDRVDVDTAQQPGKIMHELRSAPLELPNEGVHLPPVYYGTVDATPLWVCLLADAHDAGMPEAEVRELLPALRAALGWLTEHGMASGHGFIDYIDESGRGLANQGWKDSGDSIQWRDGSLAQGPIALCEVQGYAYEAAMRGGALFDALGEPGGSGLRTWAEDLRRRFREAYWVETPEGRYPAIALDAAGRPVDTLTSNIGHLVGTGILDPAEEADVAALLLGDSMSSGFGIRTMSTGAAGFWPLSYHGGSVWAHDTAIAAHGMSRAGLHDQALSVVSGLLAAAEGFAFRVPELHSGDSAAQTPSPTPYPAACRPQAWSAAAAIVCLDVVNAAGAR